MQKQLTILALFALAAAARAGEPLPAVFVTDTTNDNVWRLQDFNGDGDYNDAGEVVEYYSDVLGPFTFSNNNVAELGDDGTLYIGDTSNDAIYALNDTDFDGECNDVGEIVIFFDQTNASGIDMSSIGDLHFGADGRLWGANANNGGGGFDGIFWMQDGNADGDANDVGEAGIYYNIMTTAVGDSNPFGVTFGPGGELYYVENGSLLAKGLWRLEDTDMSGTIDQPGEAQAFFVPAVQPNTPFFWDVEVGGDGAFYMADTGNELVWQVRDTNANDVIDNGTGEDVLWWQGTSSLIWQLQMGRGASVFAAESQAPDRVLRFSDDDLSGTIDQAGETVAVYDDTVSATVIGNPRGMAVDLSGGYGISFCDASDGSLASCPCGPGEPDTGCDTPIPAMQGGGLTGGVKLTVVAQEKNVTNRATLTGENLPIGSAPGFVCFRNTGLDSAAPVVFGDGIRCVEGAGVVRLGAGIAAGGVGTITFGHGAMAGNGTFYYQLWFRSTPISYCDPVAAFNLSNGQTLTW